MEVSNNKRKKIIIVRSLKGYPDSRVEKEVYSLSKEYDVKVFGWDRDGEYSNPKSTMVMVFGKEIEYVHVGIKAPRGEGFKRLFRAMLCFWKMEYNYLKKNVNQFDAIHACDFDTAFVASIIARKYKKKLIYDIFDYYAESHKGPAPILRLIKHLDDSIIERADITIICSEQRREQIKDSNPREICVIHNSPISIPLKENRIILDNNDMRPSLVYVGLLSKDRYLEKITKVIARRSDIVWHVGGWGVLDEYFRNISEKYENIIYYGEVPYTKALQLESECSIMTALYDPSLQNHKYAAPNKFYEALMLGKPLIMMKNTGMDETIKTNNLGVVLECNEEDDWCDAFSNALDMLLNNRQKWDELSIKAKSIYQNEFSWDRMEERLLREYKVLFSTQNIE